MYLGNTLVNLTPAGGAFVDELLLNDTKSDYRHAGFVVPMRADQL